MKYSEFVKKDFENLLFFWIMKNK